MLLSVRLSDRVSYLSACSWCMRVEPPVLETSRRLAIEISSRLALYLYARGGMVPLAAQSFMPEGSETYVGSSRCTSAGTIDREPRHLTADGKMASASRGTDESAGLRQQAPSFVGRRYVQRRQTSSRHMSAGLPNASRKLCPAGFLPITLGPEARDDVVCRHPMPAIRRPAIPHLRRYRLFGFKRKSALVYLLLASLAICQQPPSDENTRNGARQLFLRASRFQELPAGTRSQVLTAPAEG